MNAWQHIHGTQNLLHQLTNLITRTQRLVVAQRLERLEAMLQMHTPTLEKDLRGKEALAKIKETFAQARAALKDC